MTIFDRSDRCSCGPMGLLYPIEYEYEQSRAMWCTEVAGGDFLIFLIVVSGDIGDNGLHINPVITPRGQ